MLEKTVKKLGFGLMRLPKKDGATDIEQTKQMVDRFLEAGFTYFDTAWAYGDSEDVTRQVLVERYPRESFLLATKNAAWTGCTTREDAYAQFETSLKRTGAGYFDFYLLHNLGENRTKIFEDFDMWRFVREKKAEGLIRHIGFSFHSTPEELDEILNQHPEAEFVQLQINYADWENPTIRSRECWEVARRHGKPVVIMEPVKGGILAQPPQPVKEVFRAAQPEASFASWALRFAADCEGVLVVLSGMSDLAQMEDNISTLRHFTELTPDERKTLSAAREAMERIPMIPCTVCNYCAKVCPMNIGVSGTFTAMNLLSLYENLQFAQGREKRYVADSGKARAAECIGCGACEEVCPQHIAIREELKKAAAALG